MRDNIAACQRLNTLLCVFLFINRFFKNIQKKKNPDPIFQVTSHYSPLIPLEFPRSLFNMAHFLSYTTINLSVPWLSRPNNSGVILSFIGSNPSESSPHALTNFPLAHARTCKTLVFWAESFLQKYLKPMNLWQEFSDEV